MQHLVTALQGVAQLVKLGLSTNQKVQKHSLQVAKDGFRHSGTHMFSKAGVMDTDGKDTRINS